MNAADELQNRLLRHQVFLQRYIATLRKRLSKIITRSDQPAVSELTARLDAIGPLRPQQYEQQVLRVEQMLNAVNQTRSSAFAELERVLMAQMAALATDEVGFTTEAIKVSLPVDVTVKAVPLAQIGAAIRTRPMRGRLMRDWAKSLKSADRQRLSQAIRLGVLEGRTTDEIVRTVRGNPKSGFTDGIMQASRRDAEAIVRTGVAHVSNAARNDVFEANSDIIQAYKVVATLDGRTTAVCRARDGKILLAAGVSASDFPKADILTPRTLRPPFHWGCRTTLTAVFDIDAIASELGERPFVRDARTRRRREQDFRAEAKAAVGKEAWSKLTEKQRRGLISDRRREWTEQNVGRERV